MPVRVVDVQVSDLTPPDLPWAGATTTAQLQEAIRAGLGRAGIAIAAAPGPSQPGDFRLRLDVRLEGLAGSADSEGKGLLRALVRGRLVAEHGVMDAAAPALGRLEQEAVAEKIFAGADLAKVPPKTWSDHALRAVQDTAEALGAQLALLQAPDEALRKLVARKDADPDQRGVAIRLLGQHKDGQAVPQLIELLKDPEAEVRDKAIGALIDIGDRRAVKPLAASAAFQDTYELGKILEAVASLGGEEARSYLSFVAAGHQSEIIRGEAKVALSHLEQREQRQKQEAGGKVSAAGEAP